MKITAEDIAQLLASPPPRSVPAPVSRAVLGGGAAWFLPLIALVFGGIGLIAVAAFFPWRIRDDWRLAAGAARTTLGVITAVNRTNLSINKRRVMEYVFRYTADDGRQRQGRCYTTGQLWANQAAVAVRYLPAEPELACVEGARLSEGGGGAAMVLLFPLIGGGLMFWFVTDRRRTRRLLREGSVTEVDVIAVEGTSTRVNRQTVYKIVISSPGLRGGQPVTVRRFNPLDVNLARKHFQDKQPVFVLYDPRDPQRVIFPEALITDGS